MNLQLRMQPTSVKTEPTSLLPYKPQATKQDSHRYLECKSDHMTRALIVSNSISSDFIVIGPNSLNIFIQVSNLYQAIPTNIFYLLEKMYVIKYT